MTTKQKFLSKDIWARTAEIQPFFAFLSIIQNFSLGVLCKALHNALVKGKPEVITGGGQKPGPAFLRCHFAYGLQVQIRDSFIF